MELSAAREQRFNEALPLKNSIYYCEYSQSKQAAEYLLQWNVKCTYTIVCIISYNRYNCT